MGLRKQFRQWKREITALWGKFSFVARLLFGAVICAVFILIARKKFTDPLKKELAELKKKAPKESVGNVDTDKEIKDNKDKTAQLKRSIAIWNKRLKSSQNADIPIDITARPLITSSIRNLLHKYSMTLVDQHDIEKKVESEQSTFIGSRRKAVRNTPKKPKEQPAQDSFTKHVDVAFTVRGGFSSINSFFNDLEKLPYLFKVKRIELSMQDPRQGLLNCEFDISVMYVPSKK